MFQKKLPFTQEQSQQLSALIRAELANAGLFRPSGLITRPEPTVLDGARIILAATTKHVLQTLDRIAGKG